MSEDHTEEQMAWVPARALSCYDPFITPRMYDALGCLSGLSISFNGLTLHVQMCLAIQSFCFLFNLHIP
ncbi:hypothetical protein M422DRAFT_266803 [Sphaerobolus stellatus SS14]|uniref:Uncharacterized protein n=1 Tax=Sphaerobolus stellatus (strain SS14) TaxID=990650 RepID=A0A0C9UQT1_SPHS4|nr:hypothetical protein M422DRAFT_266803 [Sphaerobolus stellatus SS14]